MKRVNILYIPDIEKLIRLIEKSQGQVSMLCRDHFLYDLKQESAGMEVLRREVRRRAGVDVLLSNEDDYFRFIDYLVCAGYD